MGLLDRLFMKNRPPSKECMRVGEVLQMYLDGEFEGDASWIADHLDDCAHCGLEAEAIEAMKAAITRQGRPSPEARHRLQEFADRLASGDLPDVVDDHV